MKRQGGSGGNDVRWTTKGTARRMANALANMMLGKGMELGQKRDSTVKKGRDLKGTVDRRERI